MFYICFMRKHNGMRPQDIAVLLKIIAKGNKPWQNKDLARELHISPSEISESINRSITAGLLGLPDKHVFKQSLLEFIEHGLHYVYPVVPGGMSNGIYTAHSHPFMEKLFKSEMKYVWPDPEGKVRGLSIEPLYKEQVDAAEKDALFYKMMALVDVMRVGRVREWKVAMNELNKVFNNGAEH
jgi:hypothetical protein